MAETKTGLEGVLKIKWGQTGTASVAAGSAIGYVTGLSYEYTNNPIHVFDGSTYAHSKQQRVMGKATAKSLFVDNAYYNKLGTTDGNVTQGRHYIELQVNGIAGTGEDVYCFRNCVLENMSRDIPEEEGVTEEWTFFFDHYRKLAFADRLIT
jgi:hypothetical protein